MPDLGEWSEDKYYIEAKLKGNEIKREEINKRKLECVRDEILLDVEKKNIDIEEKERLIENLKKELEFLKEKHKEKSNGG